MNRLSAKLRHPKIEAFFSPKGGCADQLANAITSAKKQVRIAIYEFNHRLIGDACIVAKQQGVDVEVVGDDKVNRDNAHSQVHALAKHGIPVYLDATHRIFHDKYTVIDGKVTWTGSFNYTYEAENDHAENLISIWSPVIAAKYLANWAMHLAHSKPLTS